MSWLKGALIQKDYAVGTFLDIEGAFNNVQPEAVIRTLNKFEVEGNLKHIIYSLLCDRTVEAEWENADFADNKRQKESCSERNLTNIIT